MFFMFMSLSAFLLAELRSLGIKTIWEFTHKWVLAPKYARSIASKALKGFIYVFVLFLVDTTVALSQPNRRRAIRHHYPAVCRVTYSPRVHARRTFLLWLLSIRLLRPGKAHLALSMSSGPEKGRNGKDGSQSLLSGHTTIVRLPVQAKSCSGDHGR